MLSALCCFFAVFVCMFVVDVDVVWLACLLLNVASGLSDDEANARVEETIQRHSLHLTPHAPNVRMD